MMPSPTCNSLAQHRPGSLRRSWLTALLLAASLLAPWQARTAFAIPPATLTGHPAPAFTRSTLDHHPIALANYRGKVILLNFWATWCGPCLTEIPQFSAWQRQYPKLQVLGISMDDDPAPVLQSLARLHPGYPIAMGDPHLAHLYGGVYGLPVTFLIDKRGIVRYRHRGAAPIPQLQSELTQLLTQ